MVFGQQRGCALADYDRDGDMDLVVGHFRTPGSPWVEIWENRGGKR